MSILSTDVVQVKLSRGMVAIIDAEDAEIASQYKWHAHKGNGTFYARYKPPKGRSFLLHRVILNAPEGVPVDHINGNGLDNRKSNLRLCTPSQNKQNGRKYRNPGGCSSVFKGVSFRSGGRHKRRWKMDVTINGKHHTSSYETELAAALAYDRLSRELFGEFARTNFP